MNKKVLVLGATGSIGTSTLDIIFSFPNKFSLIGISANKDIEKLLQIKKKFSLKDSQLCLTGLNLKNEYKDIYFGKDSLDDFIKNSNADIVVNGIAGAAGVLPSFCAIKSKIPLALANKETMVLAGTLIKKLAKENNVPIIPVDSEHSAIFNLLYCHTGSIFFDEENVKNILLTASGGPFRTWPSEKIMNATVEQALNHPTWSMGKKITIDSASMANKGMEVMEAVQLFSVKPENIKVVIHKESIIHSMITLKDNTVYAQMSNPDMRHPILSALTWPEPAFEYLEQLDLTKIGNLSFEEPRKKDFPLLDLAFECARKDAAYPIAYNAANEIAVAAFLDKQIVFGDLSSITEKVLQLDWTVVPQTEKEIYDLDLKARNIALNILRNKI